MERSPRRMCGLVIGLIAALMMVSTRSNAESFADIGIGAAVTQNADVNDHATGTKETFEFDPSFSASVRAGHWLEGIPWLGVAGSASFFMAHTMPKNHTPDEKTNDLNVIPLSVLLMFRAPLMTSTEYPNGQLQPYLGVGPSLFVAAISRPKQDGGSADTSVELGGDARTGVLWQFMPSLGVFCEYGLTYFHPDFKLTDPVTTEKFKIDTELLTHRFLVGVRVPF